VADGIAEALVTTELGLAMALPGLALGAWLDRKEERLQQELEWLETWTNAEGSNGE
jgi:biopolymer transport protein ExbB